MDNNSMIISQFRNALNSLDLTNNQQIRQLIIVLEQLNDEQRINAQTCRDTHKYLPRLECECVNMSNKVYLTIKIINDLKITLRYRNLNIVFQDPHHE